MKNFWLNKKTKLPQNLGMGLGQLGSPEVRFIRKWRYMVEFLQNSEVVVEPCFVKIGQRPSCPIGPGELSLTYYDVPNSLMTVLARLYDKAEDVTMNLRLYDGCGNGLEQWNLTGIKLVSVDFGEPGYTSEETCELGVNLSYENSGWENLTSWNFSK